MRETEDRLRALMLRGMGGDAAAHSELLRDLAVLVRAFYGRRLGSGAADLEDLVQETLIAIHTRRITYRPGEPLTPWVFAIARYKLIDHFRRRGRRITEPLEAALFVTEAGGQEASAAASDLERLLAQLPEKQRSAIRSVKLAGLSVTEAAAASGQSESAIKVSVHRGLRSLAARVRRSADRAD